MAFDPESEIAALERGLHPFFGEAAGLCHPPEWPPEIPIQRVSRLSRLSFVLLEARELFEAMLANLSLLGEGSPSHEGSWAVCAKAGSRLSLLHAEAGKFPEAEAVFLLIPRLGGYLPGHPAAAAASGLICRHLAAKGDLAGAKRVFFLMSPKDPSPRILLLMARTANWLVRRLAALGELGPAMGILDFLAGFSPPQDALRGSPQGQPRPKLRSARRLPRPARARLTLVGSGISHPDGKGITQWGQRHPNLSLLGGIAGMGDDWRRADRDLADLREFARVQARIAETVIPLFWQDGPGWAPGRAQAGLDRARDQGAVEARLAKSGLKILIGHARSSRWSEVEGIFERIPPGKSPAFQALKARAAYELALHHAAEGDLAAALGRWRHLEEASPKLPLQFEKAYALKAILALCGRLGLAAEAERLFRSHLYGQGDCGRLLDPDAACAVELIGCHARTFSDPGSLRMAERAFRLLDSSPAPSRAKHRAEALSRMVMGALEAGDMAMAEDFFARFDCDTGLAGPSGTGAGMGPGNDFLRARAARRAMAALSMVRAYLANGRPKDAEEVFLAMAGNLPPCALGRKHPLHALRLRAAEALTARPGGLAPATLDAIQASLAMTPRSRGLMARRLALAERILRHRVLSCDPDQSLSAHRELATLWASFQEGTGPGFPAAGPRMALEGSWAGSLADLIGALASQGRLREAHRLYADLCKLGDSPDTLAHRARARELCCGPWADKVKGHVTPET